MLITKPFMFTESIPGVCLVPALMIGHWPQDGQLHRDSEGHHNVFVFQSHEDLINELITLFTFEGQTVVDGRNDARSYSVTSPL